MTKPLFAITDILFGKMSICAQVGAIIGSLTGFIFTIITTIASRTPALNVTLIIGLMTGFTGWMFVVLSFGLFLHYGIPRPVSLSLLVALLIGVVTAYICTFTYVILPFPVLYVFLGLIIGIILGSLLCKLSCYPYGKKGNTKYSEVKK